MDQIVLARIAHVAPRTLVRVEKNATALIALVAKAKVVLPVGHKVNALVGTTVTARTALVAPRTRLEHASPFFTINENYY